MGGSAGVVRTWCSDARLDVRDARETTTIFAETLTSLHSMIYLKVSQYRTHYSAHAHAFVT